MRRYDADGRIPTLDVAVSEFMNAEDLKKLGALTGDKLPPGKQISLRSSFVIWKVSVSAPSGKVSMRCSERPWPK